MPTLWYIRDGRTPYTEFGPGQPVSFDEAVALFGTEELRYIGPTPPSIQPDAPSEGPENVILQLDAGEGTNLLLPQAGFYWAASLHPDDADARLRKERKTG
ncbi:hypothetical protein [Lysobacter xanthus]